MRRFRKGQIVEIGASVWTKKQVPAQTRPRHKEKWEIDDLDFVFCGRPVNMEELEKCYRNDSSVRHSGTSIRPLMRIEYYQPVRALIVGWSVRKSGILVSQYFDSDGIESGGYIAHEQRHDVYLVQLMDSERWHKPIPVLESDIFPPGM